MITSTNKHDAAERVFIATSAASYGLTLADIEGIAAVEADPEADPPVEAVEFAAGILDDPNCILATVWAAESVYRIGQRVIPTEANETGFWYQVLPGSNVENPSGATEPRWPRWIKGYVSDNGLLWLNLGAAPAWLWSLSMAEHLVYRRALAKFASKGGKAQLDARDTFDGSGLIEALQYLCESTAPFSVA